MAPAMYFAAEVRSDEEVRADLSLVSEQEIALAKSLVALAGPFEPPKYRERLEGLIAAKVEGRQAATVTVTTAAKPAADVMEALRKSLEAVRAKLA
jgi:non-homologous end joining protein Ku